MQLTDETSFDSFTIRDLCRAANISAGTFYHYFSGKNALLAQMFVRIDDAVDEAYKALTPKMNACEKIISLCAAYGKFAELSVNKAEAICRIKYDSYDVSLISEKRLVYQYLFELLTVALAQGELVSNLGSKQLTEMFLVTLRGYVYDWARYGGIYPLEKAICQHVGLLLSALTTK